MSERTPTEEASKVWADAVFADPKLRERFEAMAERTMNTEPVSDDFAFLGDEATERDEYGAFERLTRALVRVPKSAIDAARHAKRA